MLQKFLIRDTDRFVPSEYPHLEENLQQAAAQLANWSAGPKTEMMLSFVKDHSISSQQVKDHPELAKFISSHALPLHEMEALFEASRQNLLFRKQLENYIETYLNNDKL